MVIKIIKKAVNTELQNELNLINNFLNEQKSVPNYILEQMKKYTNKNAILDEHNNIKMNYAEVVSDIELLASGLQSLDVKVGDFVSLFSENQGRHFIINQAILYSGATSVLRGEKAPKDELEFILNHSESKALIIPDIKLLKQLTPLINNNEYLKFIVLIFGEKPETTDLKIPIYTYDELKKLGKEFNFVQPEVSLEDTATMLYTSGTTGFPKGVMLSHKNILSQFPSISNGLGINYQEKSLQILPVWHSYEMTTQALFFATGLYLHFTSLPNLKNDMQKYKIDIFMSVPRIWEAMRLGIYQKLKKTSKLSYLLFDFAIKSSINYKIHKMYSEKRITSKETGYNFLATFYHKIARSFVKPIHILATKYLYKKIKTAIGLNFRASFSGGGALLYQDELFYDAIGVNIRTGYGLTETSPDLTLRHAKDKNYLGSVGKPIIGTEIKIIDPQTKDELGIFQKGVVLVRGPQVMKGYYKDEKATKEIINSENWLNTGDLGWLTSDNHLVLIGRMKETIVLSNGENIEPVPIEEACLQSQYIEQIILVGQDENSIGALVVPTQDALEKCGMAIKDLKKGNVLSIKDINLQELIKKEIDTYIKNKPNLRPFEKIKKLEILKDAFNQENGLLSQSGKTKRNKVFEKYKDIIVKMFSDKKNK